MIHMTILYADGTPPVRMTTTDRGLAEDMARQVCRWSARDEAARGDRAASCCYVSDNRLSDVEAAAVALYVHQ